MFIGDRPLCVAPAVPANEQARLEAVRTTSLLHPQSVLKLHELAYRVRSLLQVAFAGINLVRAEDQQVVAAATDEVVAADSREASFCGHAILRPDELMVVLDAARDDRFRANPSVIGPPHIRFYAAAPIRGRGGEALGTLCVYDGQPRTSLSGHARDVLRTTARAVERLA